jgi:GTP-binding protein HflX
LRVGWAGYGDREVVITDTVGFIRDLPKDLFAAFRATFEEAADADVLVHVVDASDSAKDDHIKTTEKVLADLDLTDIPKILVFNKSDVIDPFDAKLLEKTHPGAVVLSATHRETTRALIETIAKLLAERWERAAKTPSVPDVQTLAEEEPPHGQMREMTTVEEMLRAAGKRSKARSLLH